MTANLRALLAQEGKPLVVPGASDALSARLIEAHGYECVYIGSYATAASGFRMPDTGRLSLDQLAAHAKSITAAVRVPVIADAEAGLNPEETVRQFAAAGVAAIHIEDHTGADMVFPTMVGQRELDEVRRRVARPVMIVDNPEEQHAGAAIVLYYAFSVTRSFDAIRRALASGALASDTRALEDFLGYKDDPGRSHR